MAVRKLLLAAVGLAAVASTSSPALAEDFDGVNSGSAGAVVAYAEGDDPDETLRGHGDRYRVDGACEYGGVLTPNNTVIVEYGGVAVATMKKGGTKTPQVVYIQCRIFNNVNSQSAGAVLNGTASAIADSTALAEDGPKEWRLQDGPITICVTTWALFGTVNPFFVTRGEHCKTPGL